MSNVCLYFRHSDRSICVTRSSRLSRHEGQSIKMCCLHCPGSSLSKAFSLTFMHSRAQMFLLRRARTCFTLSTFAFVHKATNGTICAYGFFDKAMFITMRRLFATMNNRSCLSEILRNSRIWKIIVIQQLRQPYKVVTSC